MTGKAKKESRNHSISSPASIFIELGNDKEEEEEEEDDDGDEENVDTEGDDQVGDIERNPPKFSVHFPFPLPSKRTDNFSRNFALFFIRRFTPLHEISLLPVSIGQDSFVKLDSNRTHPLEEG